MNKRYSQHYQFQWNYTLVARHVGRRQRARPVQFRYARADNLAPEYNYSDRDQRHRFNAWLLVTAGGLRINNRVSARSAQPQIGRRTRRRLASSRTARSSSATPCARTTSSSPGTSASRGRSRSAIVGDDRADLRDLQPDQQQEHPPAGGDEPDLQLRRHGPERPRRSAPGAARGPGQVLRNMKLAGLLRLAGLAGLHGLEGFSG